MSPLQIDNRRRICEQCPHRKGILCGKCGCILWLKRRMKSQHCPLKKWPRDKAVTRPSSHIVTPCFCGKRG